LQPDDLPMSAPIEANQHSFKDRSSNLANTPEKIFLKGIPDPNLMKNPTPNFQKLPKAFMTTKQIDYEKIFNDLPEPEKIDEDEDEHNE
jgi:hypothetical protein